MYFVGAVLYLLAALRDCGVFFWLPFVPGCAVAPTALEVEKMTADATAAAGSSMELAV